MKPIKELITIIFILFFLNSIESKGQTMQDEFCRPGSTQATFFVNFFLTAQQFAAERIESGTSNIPTKEIMPVNNEENCRKLYNLIQGNEAYRRVDQKKSDDVLYFYETNDFYYVLWVDNKIKMGSSVLFLVISKDFLKIWEFYV